MKVLFLYTELAGYFLKCCEELSKNAEVHIVRWPVNKEAPFAFNFPAGIKVYEKSDFSFTQLEEFVKQLAPDMIVCSGWVDKDYLRLTRPYFKRIPTVVTCDTHWKASLKQYMALVLGRLFLINIFSHAWVPGKAQKRYVKLLGFKDRQIKQGFYVCDLPAFNSMYEKFVPLKRTTFPKRFLYVGRYYDFKGITDLWTAFANVQSQRSSDWELWCLGTGSITPVQHPKIKHFGFVQPSQLESFLKDTGVFVLPSRFEPWGVVVQEYAAAGFPMLLSDEVGAKEAFLQEGKNGWSFRSRNISELEACLRKIMELSPKELILMAETSHQLAQVISPSQWAATVTEIDNEFRKK